MKIREIILEAAYDSMIVAMKAKYPNYAQPIDEQVKWAKTNLKKADRVVWYMKIVRATIEDLENNTNTADELFGNFSEHDLGNLQHNLLHFYGYNSPNIENYQFGKQTVEQVIADLTKYETEFKNKQDKVKPVTPQKGDYELIKFPDGSAWWFVDRGYCPEEGRSGKHCGNVVGQHKTDERILSYRVGGHVMLTFILHADGYLGEMKAKNNQKPSEKYHNVIMALLLSGKINGIRGAGWGPEFNFSIFDLNDKDLKVIISKKPTFVKDQIIATPMEFLKAPPIIRNNPEYQQIAVGKLPALRPLLSGDSIANWEEAIKQDSRLIIHAPSSLPDFENRVVGALVEQPRLITQAPKVISRNTKIMIDVVEQDGHALKYIPNTLPEYKEIALAAVQQDGNAIQYVPDTLPEYKEIALAAVQQYDNALTWVPPKLRDYDMCMAAVKQNGYALTLVPPKLRDYDMCMAAVKQNGNALILVPPEYKAEIEAGMNKNDELSRVKELTERLLR